MKIKLLTICMLFLSLGTYAQNMFSMSSIHPEDTLLREDQTQAIRYPALRRISVTADIFGKGKFTAKMNDKDIASGKSQNARISSFFNVPITKWDGNTISATIYHNEQFFNPKEVSNPLPDPQLNNQNISKSTLGLSLNFSRTDAIFHTPVIYSAVFTGMSDNLKAVRRFNFNGSIAFPLKQTADSYLSLGVLVQIDPSAPTPVLPVVNYFHKLNGSGLELTVVFPEGLTLKQQLAKHAWVYVGSNANTYASFYQSNNPSFPSRYSYNTIELKSGPGFEYLLGKYVILGVSGGVNNILSARTIVKGDNYSDAFIKTTGKSAAYGEFRISVLPF